MDLYLEHPHPCPYLPEQTCQNLTFDILTENESVTAQLLAAGFRHFGTRWFIPACPECAKCHGVYIDIHRFSPSKSLRKIINQNQDLRIKRSEPSATPEKVALLNRFQKDQTDRIGWNLQIHDSHDYRVGFIDNIPFCEEYCVYDGQNLIGVGFLDIAGNRASSIYFYYDPDYRNRSLGTWSVLSEIEYCRREGIAYLHLGLWNEECQSLAYKNRFQPHSFIPPRTVRESVARIENILANAVNR